MPNLDPCFKLRLYPGKQDIVSLEDNETSRIICPIEGGVFEGCGLKADIMPGGSDWVLTREDTVHIDVRTQARTSSGHGVYIQYQGILKLDEKAQKLMGSTSDGESTNFGDHEWFTHPVIQTNHPDFKWIETAFFIGQGRLIVEEKQSVEYQIYRVT